MRRVIVTDTVTVPQSAEHAERVWLDRLRDLWAASALDPDPIKAFGLSCYLQGALDALTPEYAVAEHEARAGTESKP